MSNESVRKLFKLKSKSVIVRGNVETETEGFWAKIKTRPISLEFGLILQEQIDNEDTAQKLEGMKVFGDKILLDWNVADEEDETIKKEPTGENLVKEDMSIMMLLMEGWSEAINSLSKRGEDET